MSSPETVTGAVACTASEPTIPAASITIAAPEATAAASLCVGTPVGVQLSGTFHAPAPVFQMYAPEVADVTVTLTVRPSSLRENA
ncbi:MAG: hypothetical protein BWX70_03058 [Verrucomicrobia bacterium ADurb.Bin070]|nr:MAG: hypothetical protein BWX70_03058 [Verrucomicrobia bacterium ADurb.Bin070]